MTTNVDRVREYFYRQYEVGEGTVAENIHALFAEDLVYHLSEGKTLSLEQLVQAAQSIRQTPENERIVDVYDFGEDGNTVWFTMHLRAQSPQTGEFTEVTVDHEWRFNGSGRVVEVTTREPDKTSEVLNTLSRGN